MEFYAHVMRCVPGRWDEKQRRYMWWNEEVREVISRKKDARMVMSCSSCIMRIRGGVKV